MYKIVIILLIAMGGCNTKKVDKKAEGEKLMQLSREWSKAASSGDVEKTVGYWDDSAFVMSAYQVPLWGKQAIRQMVEETSKVPGFKISWEPETVVVSDNGDMAYIIENSQISFPDSTGKIITQNNKAVTIWRKLNNGSWKNVVDISTPVGK